MQLVTLVTHSNKNRIDQSNYKQLFGPTFSSSDNQQPSAVTLKSPNTIKISFFILFIRLFIRGTHVECVKVLLTVLLLADQLTFLPIFSS